jgi:SAM-dependent methyltransferase
MPPTLRKPVQPEQLNFLFEARAASEVLAASVELGILDRLGQGPVDAATLARECHIREETAPALLAALATLGLAEPHEHGTYRAINGDLTGFLELLRRWDGFADGLRHRPEVPAGAPPGADDAFSRTVGPLAAFCAPAAEKVAEHLAGAGLRVLDLGAGAAPWGLALAAADPECVVTAVDLPVVLPITRQAVAATGREGQFHFVGEDMFTVTLEERAYDLVIVGNLCHLLDESANRRLLSRAARWLAPGGTVAIIDFLLNERGDSPRGVALYAVELVRRTPVGQVYPFSSYAGWLRAAGYEGVERIELSSPPPVTLVRARRP